MVINHLPSCRGLRNMDAFSKSDPMCVVSLQSVSTLFCVHVRIRIPTIIVLIWAVSTMTEKWTVDGNWTNRNDQRQLESQVSLPFHPLVVSTTLF